MPERHALLSPSKAHITIPCPASLKLSEGIDDKPGVAAKEGTEAHALCEYLLRKAFGEDVKDPVPTMQYYTPEMMDHCMSYVNHVTGVMREALLEDPEAILAIEEMVDFSKWTDVESFGTADCLIITNRTIHVIDFKYGYNLVEAKENPQMMCYALGALQKYGFFYDAEFIDMTIFQPRKFNVSNWVTTKEELLKWATETLQPAVEEAVSGKAKPHAGEHCRYCPARHLCEERATYHLALEEKMETPVAMLTDEDIESVLNRADDLRRWVADVEEYALNLAVTGGKKWKGFTVGQSTTRRKYSDENEVAKAVQDAGFDPYEKRLIGIPQMKKLLGKELYEEILAPYIVKPEGKPKLIKVKEDD